MERILTIKEPKAEYMTNPICVPLERIRFSWEVEATTQNQRQLAYQILVKREATGEMVWDSGKVLCDDMTGILYDGKPLCPRAKYVWQVRVWSEADECTDYCASQSFETTLSAEEWDRVHWIGASVTGLPLFRKNFTVESKEIVHARIYVSGLGAYELTINGKQVDNGVLNPMVTRYHKQYFYNAYDITPFIREGENVFGIMLGNGYYGMHDNGVDWQKKNWANAPWADKPKCKLLAFITYEDGTETLICTDESWKTMESPIRVDEAYYGEEYDARMEWQGWKEIGFDDGVWRLACCVSAPKGQAEIQLAESCKIIENLSLFPLYHEENESLFDTKKMTVGWVKIIVRGNRGDEVEISYSEWIDDEGKLEQRGLLSEWDYAGRTRKPQTDYFILSGGGEETFAPHFTYKGFRYVRIRTKGEVTIENVVVEVVHTDLTEIGGFECSDEFVNQLHEACKNTLLNNFHSYPSDTPVYENMGYLADGYLTQEMAHYNFDVTKYYEKWSRDILEQAKENGYIEQTAPMWDEDKENAPEWSLAIAIVPYQIYRFTGDKTALFRNYEKAKKVFVYQMALTSDGIASSMWGDHACASGNMIREISPTAYLFYTANILAETAKLQGNEMECEHYKAQADYIKSAFNTRFYDKKRGCYVEPGKTEFLLNAQVLPYALGLADENQKAKIKENIKKYAISFDGGIFSVKYLFPVLSEMGLENRLYEWVKAKDAPSWGYWLSFGDCSLWEQWYDFTRSRNHHMFGTVDEWLYKTLAGLEIIDAKTLKIKPFIAEKVEWANAYVKMPSGKASCRWEKQGENIILELEVPFNVTATVHLSKGEILEIGSGKYRFQLTY